MSAGTAVDRTAAPDMSAVPEHLKARGANADEMMRRMAEGKDPYGRDEPAADQPVVDPQPAATTQQPAPTAQQPQPAAQQPQPAATTQQADTKAPDYEQMYKSLKGSFDGLRQRHDTAVAEIGNLRNIIAQMEARGVPTEEPTTRTAVADLTEDERAEYGPEFFAMMDKYVGKALEPIQAENARLKQQLGGVTQMTTKNAREKMHDALDTDVPTWRALNDDENFKEWLQNIDMASGQPRHNLLLQAYGQNETARVAHFFSSYLRETGAGANTTEAPKASNGRAAAPQDGLAKFAAPGKSKTSTDLPAGGEAAKPVFKLSDITKFYADKRTGVYRGREAEADRLEADIFAAQAENRIVNG